MKSCILIRLNDLVTKDKTLNI